MIRIGINGFGRIGRCLLRAYINLSPDKREKIKIVAINSNGMTPENSAHLLQYDSTHGRFIKDVLYGDNWIGWIENNELIKVQVIAHSKIENLMWNEYGLQSSEIITVTEDSIKSSFCSSTDQSYFAGQLQQTTYQSQQTERSQNPGVDVVMECTGAFNNKHQAEKHIIFGKVKKVIISAPCSDADKTVVLGANEDILSLNNDNVISIGSCTTNCLAPIAKALEDSIGIESGFMTTIHSYTGDQQLLDNRHQDKRRARAAGLSMIPTSTGAASTIGKIIPSLNGKLDGVAIRVPTPNVSMIDFTFISKSIVNIQLIHEIIRLAALKYPKVISINDKDLVSIDFNGDTHSAIFDSTQTRVIDNKLVRIVAWYDNESGFVNRMLDIACMTIY